jgi:flavoprotein hydroxylase
VAAPVDRFDVAIVGAGPVGCTLALLLADRGRSVCLLERHDAPYPLPRAVHFDDETARILQGCGIGPALAGLSEPATTYEWRNGAGVPLLRFETPALGRQGWPSANMFNQPDLEAELVGRIDAHRGITFRRGLEAVAVEQGPAAVVLRARPTGGGDGPVTEAIGSTFLIGCDGANSTIRELLGIGMEDHGFFFDWLVVDVTLHEPRVFDPPNLQVCDPARPTTAVSGGPGRRRWEFMCLPGESLDALADDTAAWALLEPWDVTPGNATMVRHAGYRFRARWATRWHEGRVFLAGDAAHQTPPFAGQGMCAGLRDAANLAWKIDYVLSRPDGADLLESYDVERIPQAAAVIGLATDLGKVICIPDADEAGRRDAAMAVEVLPDASTPVPPLPGLTGGILREGSPLAGELFLQGRIRADGAEGLFDDVLGGGWHLIAAGPGPAIPAGLAEWFAELGGRIVVLGEEVDDLDGCYTAWFRTHGLRAALQRPDFHLFGTASSGSDVVRLLDDLRRALEGPTDLGCQDGA